VISLNQGTHNPAEHQGAATAWFESFKKRCVTVASIYGTALDFDIRMVGILTNKFLCCVPIWLD
jgi:hypothetical protein